MAGRVSGKVAVVTGAARGMGRSHAIRLAQEGADIIALDACTDVASIEYSLGTIADLEETAQAVESLGSRVVSAQVDVRDFDALQAAIDSGVAALGGLDIVVANAGIVSVGPTEDLSEAMWDDVVDINLKGVWHTCKATIPHLKAGGRGGSMVLVSSSAGLKAFQNLAHYVSAKHGVVGLTRTIALELAPFSIRANSIHPTNTNTPMIHNPSAYKLFCPDKDAPTRDDFFEASKSMAALPISWVEPEDVSNAVLFLASDEARFITGSALAIDGGLLTM